MSPLNVSEIHSTVLGMTASMFGLVHAARRLDVHSIVFA